MEVAAPPSQQPWGAAHRVLSAASSAGVWGVARPTWKIGGSAASSRHALAAAYQETLTGTRPKQPWPCASEKAAQSEGHDVRLGWGLGRGELEKEGEALMAEGVVEGVCEGVGEADGGATGRMTTHPSPPTPDDLRGQQLPVQPPTDTLLLTHWFGMLRSKGKVAML